MSRREGVLYLAILCKSNRFPLAAVINQGEGAAR
ncbi:hypothetical protein E2C01_086614 [Portunus trituberculatus]|uniref:Uncharacterized protein n=1 Tax=Portunus trituberculatus TaxID=210409 RepID=A0A5B7J9S5_PORTR|nr:hypothetical protein [Portunus trituberculatus]